MFKSAERFMYMAKNMKLLFIDMSMYSVMISIHVLR